MLPPEFSFHLYLEANRIEVCVLYLTDTCTAGAVFSVDTGRVGCTEMRESICINISSYKHFFLHGTRYPGCLCSVKRPLRCSAVQSLIDLLLCRLGVSCGRTRGRPNGQTHRQHEKFCPSVEVGSWKKGPGDFEERLQLEVHDCLGHFFMHKMQQPERRPLGWKLERKKIVPKHVVRHSEL